jgi:hypothetical protein
MAPRITMTALNAPHWLKVKNPKAPAVKNDQCD